MTTLHLCLLAAIFLPYVWVSVSSVYRKQQFGTLDNNNPRDQAAKMSGPGARANAAQNNSWEALAVFAPSVLVVLIGNPSSSVAPMLATGWVALRVFHGIAYIADKAALRSALFVLSSLCALGLFLAGAKVI